MSSWDRQSGPKPSGQPGPWGRKAAEPADRASQQARGPTRRGRTNLLSIIAFVTLVAGVSIQAFQDLSRPEAWAYWKDLYFTPSMTSSVVAEAELGDLGHRHSALAIKGTIGAASASWFRDQLAAAHLVPGDVVLLSSPGGDVEQALIMGEVIRQHGLATAVGTMDASGRVTASYCASACVFVFAGGKVRFGTDGSKLGVHRFVSNAAGDEAVAETQRTAGLILGYMTRMGVSSSVVEAMSATRDIRWLGVQEARAMNLITDPLGAQ